MQSRSVLLSAIALGFVITACDDKAPTPTPDTPVEAPAATTEADKPDTPDTAEAKVDEVEEKDGADDKDDADAKKDPAKVAAKDNPAKAKTPEPKEEEPTKGTEKTEPQYSVWMQGGGNYKVGKSSAVQAVLIAKEGWKCNDEYPYKVKLNAAPEGVSFPDAIARAASVSKGRTTVSVPFTPSSAGAKTITGKFYFSVCNESTCKIQKAPLSVTVNVAE